MHPPEQLPTPMKPPSCLRLSHVQKSASLTDRDEGEAEIDSSTGTSQLRPDGTSRLRPDGTSVPAPAKSPAAKANSNGSLDPDHKNR